MAQKRGKDAKIFFPFFMKGGSFRRTPTRRTGLTGRTCRRTNNKWPLSIPLKGELKETFLISRIFLLLRFREWLKSAPVFLLSLARSLLRVTTIRLLANSIRLPADSLIVSAGTIRKPTRSSRMFLSSFELKIAKIGQFLQKRGGLINR
ncbi:hypothetical protein FHS60_001340 [Alloprevotella rava]|uniref:Uncharacterized protein n=1 Tax=Alloprevotella rava TaxID=671218 RepID=A0A7W5UMR9_9BACT|nr:hypothetical protein [Alloprevotella rava]